MIKYCLYYVKHECGAPIDVFNALAIGKNQNLDETLKFGLGSGVLNFYFYNYQLVGHID